MYLALFRFPPEQGSIARTDFLQTEYEHATPVGTRDELTRLMLDEEIVDSWERGSLGSTELRGADCRDLGSFCGAFPRPIPLPQASGAHVYPPEITYNLLQAVGIAGGVDPVAAFYRSTTDEYFQRCAAVGLGERESRSPLPRFLQLLGKGRA